MFFVILLKCTNKKNMVSDKNRHGFKFTPFQEEEKSKFDQLFGIFKELITHTSGDFEEALNWMKTLDKEYKLTDEEYTLDDFIDELKERGYLKDEVDPNGKGKTKITAKTEKAIRKNALDQIFGKIKKNGLGNHKTKNSGLGDEKTGDFRAFQFGDSIDSLSITESLKNAQVNNGLSDFSLTEKDLVIEDTHHKSQMSTVLMIDISHSMILYGEDRITPAKKVAMALSELITSRYPKDTLDILVFGNDAWTIKVKDLPYLQVGPYHTNTVAGLNLAMDILRRKRNTNKHIFMITDGKPSCLRLPDGRYYKNSNGLDPYITEKCYNMAAYARKLHIPITTFMIARDPYLQNFVDKFTESNKGKAFYTGLEGLGEMIFHDYENNRKKRMR